MGRFSQFGCTRNGTSGAEIKILRPPTPPNKPPKPPKSHLRNPNRTSKSDFLPFCVFLIFSPRFPLSTGHNIKSQIYKGRRPQIKKCQKQTHFKIQFYIGIYVTSFGIDHFLPRMSYSSRPIAQVHYTCLDFLDQNSDL